MDFAEVHPKNELIPIDDEIVQDAVDIAACGEPTDLRTLNLSANAPFLFKVNELAPLAVGAYCPIWKEIKDAAFENPSTLIEWLKRKKIEINKWSVNKHAVATHVTMNHGRFHVHEKDEEDFLKWYAVSLTLSKRMWFVEQLTTVFRYFVDLDFCQLAGIPERSMEATAHVVQRVLRKFYTKHTDDLSVIVCTTNYKYVNAKADKPEMVKTGIHLLWPKIYVTRDDALDLRESILVELEEVFGKRVHPNNSWQDVVDSSVYGSGNAGTKGSGLRMLGSRKTDPCGLCKSKKTSRSPTSGREEICQQCVGNGRVDTGRPYFPLCVLDGMGKRNRNAEEEYRTNMHKLVLDTKVRSNFKERPAEPYYEIPEHAPRHLAPNLAQTRGRISNATKDAKAGITKPNDPKLQKSTRIELSNTSGEWNAVEHLIRNCGTGKYSKVVISKITTGAVASQYVVHVTGEMCRYCHNISREHASNRIYFVIDANGLFQNCHDNADTTSEEMKFGLCKNYSGNLGSIPHHLVGQLFPKCAAAKTLRDDDEAITDEEDLSDVRITKDHKLRRLYEIGDALSQELYSTSWSSTIITSVGAHIISRHAARATLLSTKTALAVGDFKYLSSVEQYAIDPAALGSRCSIALKEMGFEDDVGGAPNSPDLPKKMIPLAKLEQKLFKHLLAIVEMAAYMDPEVVTKGLECESFDGLITERLKQLHIANEENAIVDLACNYK